MFVDRGQEIKFTDDNKLESVDLDFIDIYLEDADIEALADPSRSYSTDRFMGCTYRGGLSGWAPEDKLHFRVEEPRGSEDREKFVELSLDQGGDLYFVIWNTLALHRAGEHTEFPVEPPFLIADPSNKLGQAGIRSIRIHQLVDLACQIESRGL